MSNNRRPLIALAVLILLVLACGQPATPEVNSTIPPVEVRTFTPEAFTATPAATSTPPLGDSRNNPYPMNTPVQIAGDMEVTVLGVDRPANQVVAEGNMFNDTPAPGSEYIIITMGVKCNKPSDKKCTFSPYEFKVVGSDGQVHDEASAAGVPGRFEPFPEFFGNSILQGRMVFLAGENDPLTVLFYDPMFGENLIYFAIQE